MSTPREGARLAHHSIRNSGLAQTPRGVDAGSIHIPCCDKAPHRAPAPTIPFADAGARLSGRTFRPDAFNRPQRGFDPRGAESVGTEVRPLARRTKPAARPASRVRASCAQPARPPWPPPVAASLPPRAPSWRIPDSDRPPSLAMLPALRLLARLIESGGFAWPTFPAVLGARHRKRSTDEEAVACDALPCPLLRSLPGRR